jgi:hypothetical protein
MILQVLELLLEQDQPSTHNPEEERASVYYYTCLRRSWMSHWVSLVSYVERRKLTACSLAYGNNTSVTKEMGVVVPSMSNRITLCNQYRWGTLSDSSLQARSDFSSLQIDRCGWFLCSMDKVFATLLQIFRPGFSDVQNWWKNCRVRVAVAIPHRAQILKEGKLKRRHLNSKVNYCMQLTGENKPLLLAPFLLLDTFGTTRGLDGSKELCGRSGLCLGSAGSRPSWWSRSAASKR